MYWIKFALKPFHYFGSRLFAGNIGICERIMVHILLVYIAKLAPPDMQLDCDLQI